MLLEMRGIRKSFYGNEVLHSVDLTLEAGTVLALMGENGAGKSTMMNILVGIHKRDGGTIRIDGQEVNIESPHDAQKLGIAMIHQELSSVVEMSVAENIYLGREPVKNGFIDYRKMYKDTEELLKNLNINLNPKTKMGKLRVADQQLVEIAKAVSQNARILIMDEPTSSITDREVENLYGIIRDLKMRKTGIIYISHKMEEVYTITDQITVLRDGASIATWNTKEATNDMVVKAMVGRELTEQYPKRKVEIGDTILELKNFTQEGVFENISFKLRRGEILGLVGLVGAGRTETMQALFGITKPDSGEVYLKGQKVEFKKPVDAIKNGLAYVTEDRKGEGLVLPMSIAHNITLPSMKELSRKIFIKQKEEKDRVGKEITDLKVKTTSPNLAVKNLSGGNQQKVVLAKWMLKNPDVIIFDEPTRGIDVGAKAEIYKLMNEFVAEGKAIIMISSELPEAMGMSDRILVLSNHKMSGELSKNEFNQKSLMKLAMQHM
ncbi:MAG: sugar ABC transporter ATP-binding protein [Lachnospiraceae bacterium]|uniref:Sugar ABC transporter ATP-binding protein n=2 Tax=Lachnospiraceae TaxID=186803 RepID=A0ABT2SKH7_9FIRM|nr:sugar ABC transporter ATP-binding protein [Muricoprocola aceti]MBC8573220.1 sugar ABC transporter ATP-binding protein [Jingyaoa shaoxingensis]MCI7227700.1 sugar ABC transporter ATP-binding protein [Lachnospiraceae bacterium]MCU6725008.1 sugar ABC transporter ATP-binding protein [Muricoprocola aceti]